MSKVHEIFFQYSKANDSPFLGATTRVYRVRLSDVGWVGDRYIVTQLVTDSSDRKPYVYRNELLDVTEDCHAQRAAIRIHDDLVETVKRYPQHAMCWIKQARKRNDAHTDDTDAKVNFPCVAPGTLESPETIITRLTDGPKQMLQVTGDMLESAREQCKREEALGDRLDEVGKRVYMHSDPNPKFAVGEWVRIVSHGGDHQGHVGVITEVGDFGYYAVGAAPEQPCWQWWHEECLEHADPPAPLPNLGAPIPDADPETLTPEDDTF